MNPGERGRTALQLIGTSARCPVGLTVTPNTADLNEYRPPQSLDEAESPYMLYTIDSDDRTTGQGMLRTGHFRWEWLGEEDGAWHAFPEKERAYIEAMWLTYRCGPAVPRRYSDSKDQDQDQVGLAARPLACVVDGLLRSVSI